MLKRYLKISFSGYSPERFLNMCKYKGIDIWDLEVKKNCYECFIHAKDFRKLKPLIKKSRIHIRILEKHGISFILFRYRKRKVFGIGGIVAAFLIYIMTCFVWRIEIEGNCTITSEVLYEYLKLKEIYHGMPVSQVNCEEICTQLRKDFEEIIWVSTALEGTKLKIVVRENADVWNKESDSDYQDIISDAEGTVVAIITRKGVPLVQVGDEVKPGDVLVSGILEIKNDAGEIVREESVCADADIYIKRIIKYEDFCSDTHIVKEYYKTKKKKLLITMFPYQIEVGIKKQTGKQEVCTIYYQCKLGEHFYLPIYIAEKTSREYEEKEVSYTDEEQKTVLEKRYQAYKKRLNQQEIEIILEDIVFQKEIDQLRFQGKLEVIQQVVDLY